ncbi:anti-sigma factor [Robertmurraya massiliosenegalensis]|uniref:anti-sigma factor n=1 Tax=Robertmurraya TaxID=2837507 RepID=UPI0039A6E42F
MSEWNKDKEKKILLKYRFTLTLKILRVLLAFFFLYVVYMMIVSISYDSLHLDRKNAYYSKVALEWTNPNINGEFAGFMNSEITPFLTQKISYPVFKTVGKKEKQVGEMNIRKSLLFSSQQLENVTIPEDNRFSFSLPEHPVTGEKLQANEDPTVWNTLDKLHEGTVGELAFSTTEFMTAEELIDLLEPFDLNILWAPLYTGEFTVFQPSGWGGGGNEISIIRPFGLTGGRETSDDYMSEGKMTVLSEDMLEESKKMMLTNMKNLLDEESKRYYESFLGLDYLEERYDYMQENGFIVYGAVVTGPVKELLKLKDVPEIRGERLGELDYWNWGE